jgi:hypothetical protein
MRTGTPKPVIPRVVVDSGELAPFNAHGYRGKVKIKGLKRFARTAYNADGTLAGTLIFIPGKKVAELKDKS